MKPLASVVICSYNYDRFLGEAIDSALNQTYPHVEVIVVDDGSTDQSREVIAQYGNRIVPVLQENAGHDTAINSGFQVSRGEVVCFLDSDDALFPTAVECAVDALRDPAIVKVHWPLCIVDEHGCRTDKLLPGNELPHGDLSEVVITQGPQSYLTPPTSGNAWARRFLAQVCPIRPLENRAGTADDQLSMLAPLFGRVAAIESQSVFRAHGHNNYWGRSLDDLATTLRDYEQCCDVLSGVCRSQGITVDPERWKRESWFHRLHDALQEIVDFVPEGHSFILVDGDRWGTGEWVAGRRRIPFLEHEGTYWGRPAADVEAIQEVERLRLAGASFLVIGWPAFWWREYYPHWNNYLCSTFRCAVETERLAVFDLAARV